MPVTRLTGASYDVHPDHLLIVVAAIRRRTSTTY